MTTHYKRGHAPRTYYYPTDVINIADFLHVDTHNPRSEGYGGSMFDFELEDGTVDKVKGPWHTSARGLLKDVGIDVRDLHLTRVTLWGTEIQPVTFKGHYPHPDKPGALLYGDITELRDVKVEPPIYEEKEPALGMFMRGERIAHAYVQATGKSVFLLSESAGGSSSHLVTPDSEMHVMAKNYE